jgi:peptide/nickel transport system ATP-binding protein
METRDNIILKTENLKKFFPVRSEFLKRHIGWIRAVDGVDFEVKKGEIFGLVGESGLASRLPVKRFSDLPANEEWSI